MASSPGPDRRVPQVVLADDDVLLREGPFGPNDLDHGCCLRPVSGTASHVLASTLVSVMQQAKTIATVSRQSRGHGIAELSRPQPSQVSAVMNSIWDR